LLRIKEALRIGPFASLTTDTEPSTLIGSVLFTTAGLPSHRRVLRHFLSSSKNFAAL
jgi:hypothetical protein